MSNDVELRDLEIPDDPNDPALPRRTVAPIDQKLNRAFRSVVLLGVATVYGLGMWMALHAAAVPHDKGWPYTAFAMLVGAGSIVGAILTGAALRRKRGRR